MSDLTIELKDELDSIFQKTEFLLSQIEYKKLPIFTPETNIPGVKYIRKALEDLFYDSSLDGRLTSTYLAVVSCDVEIIEIIKNINIHKNNFSIIKRKLEERDKDMLKVFMRCYSTHSPFRKRLSLMGMSRLNINELVREIPFSCSNASSVTYSHYSKGRSIKKITPEECERRLVKLNKIGVPEHIEYQRNLLGNHPRHIGLVQVQENSPLVKININSEDGVETICSSLPLFLSSKTDFDISFFSKVTKPRKTRNDKIIEDKPFLPSIHVHRKIVNT